MALFGGNKKSKLGRRKKRKLRELGEGENVITPTHETTHTSYTPGPLSKAVSDGGGYTNIGTRTTSSGIKDMGGAGVLRPTSTSSTSSTRNFKESLKVGGKTYSGSDVDQFNKPVSMSKEDQDFVSSYNLAKHGRPGPSIDYKTGEDNRSDATKLKDKTKHAELTKIFETDETGKFKDQAAVDEHMAKVGTKYHTKKVIDKASEKVDLGTLQSDGSYKGGTPTNTNQGGSREIYTPKSYFKSSTEDIATNTRENAANQDMVNKASNNKSVTENYNPPIITQGNVVSDELKSYHEAQLKKAANKPKPVVEDTSQAALEKKYGLSPFHTK